MTWVWTGVGSFLVAVALHDVFRTLWYPRGFGGLARVLFRTVWRVARGSRRFGDLAGPLGLVLTSAVWVGLLVLGFALVYLPHMPGGFYFGSSLQPADSSDLLASVYLSGVALATLGLGDILPAHPALRLLVPFQALVGFVLLTAGISWVLQLYPALTRRRTLARRLSTMDRCDAAALLRTGEPSVAVQLLEAVREPLAGVEMDLRQYGESYYFRDREPDCSLAASLPVAARLVTAGGQAEAPEVRRAAVMLDDGLEALLGLLGQQYLDVADDRQALLRAFAEDHRHEPRTPGLNAGSTSPARRRRSARRRPGS